MKITLQVQERTSKIDGTLGKSIESAVSGKQYDSVCVSVAYMTVSGMRALLPNLVAAPPATSKWLVGLDDYVTQPGAIDVILRIPGSSVRVASFREFGTRFHTKVYVFGRSNDPSQMLAIVGSSNLTAHAFRGNGEANVLLEASDKVSSEKLSAMWAELWKMGHKPTAEELANYRQKYEEAKKERERSTAAAKPPVKNEILDTDKAELDPAKAAICWIECGYITAMGREIEIKAEQGLFFGLNPFGEPPRQFDFLVSSGEIVSLKMKYQRNQMWRLQLTKRVPETARGLRPIEKDGSLGRSPYVVVVTRLEGSLSYSLRFINLRSKELKKLVDDSKKQGTFGRTSARMYGWC